MLTRYWAALILSASCFAVDLTDSDKRFLEALKNKPEAQGQIPVESISSLDELNRLMGASQNKATESLAEAATISKPKSMILPQGVVPGETTFPFKNLVFVSGAMPDRVLKALLLEADGDKDTAFVVRGWSANGGFNALRQRLFSLAAKKNGRPTANFNLICDPRLFKGYRIEAVPVFLIKSGHEWRRASGEASLTMAKIQARKRIRPVLGPLYAIAEPDLLEEIKRRMDQTNWAAIMNRARDRATMPITAGYALPEATKDKVYFVDPTVTFRDSVALDDGRVVAQAGDSVNPLLQIRLSRKYVVFDPNRAGQMDVARQWVKEDPRTMLIATSIPLYGEDLPSLQQQMGQPVFPLSRLIADRLGIISTPALVEQEGHVLRVSIKRPRNALTN